MKPCEEKVSEGSEYYVYAPSKTAQLLFFYPMQCGLFFYEPGYFLRRSAFDSFLIMYIRRGTMLLDFDGKKQKAEAGSFVLLDCYQAHGYATETGYECLWLHFDGPLARGYYQQIVSKAGNVFMAEDSLAPSRKLQGILNVFRAGQPIQEPLMCRTITDILTEFMIRIPGGKGMRRDSEMAEHIIAYINEHYHEDLTVSQLAGIAGLSLSHFIRAFRKETGYAPHAYLMQRRMASARYLLNNTGMSIKEICYSTGFSGESVFCSAFRKMHGMTPKNYRAAGMPHGDSSPEN